MQEQEFRLLKAVTASSVKHALLQAAGTKHHYTLTDSLSRSCNIEPHYKDKLFSVKETLITGTESGL